MGKRIRIDGVLYERVLTESSYREFNRQDYRDYSCDDFDDGSSPLIHKSDDGVDVILYPSDEKVDGLRDNSAIGIYYYVDETGREFVWTTSVDMSKDEALGEFETIIKLVDRIHGESVDIVKGLRRIGRKFLMTDDVIDL